MELIKLSYPLERKGNRIKRGGEKGGSDELPFIPAHPWNQLEAVIRLAFDDVVCLVFLKP